MKTFALFLFLLMLGHAQASDHEEARRKVQAGKFKPLAEVLAGVRSRHSGEILDVELELDTLGRHVYEVRLLDGKGRRRIINFDAVTGKEVEAGLERGLTDMEALLSKVLETFPGRLIDVDLDYVLVDKAYYTFLVLREDGLVNRVLADAHTGKLISNEEALAGQESVLPMDRVVRNLLKRHPGSVQEVEMKYDKDGRLLYEVEMKFPDGRVVDFSVDPVTSRVLNEDEFGER